MRRLSPLAACQIATLAFAALALTGCRSYGAYDSTAKMHASLGQAVAEFAQALPRMEGEHAELVRIAGSDSALLGVARDYQTLLQEGRAALAEEQNEVATLEGSGNYRRVAEALGATLTAQQTFSDRYVGLMMRAAGTADTTNYLEMADRSARYHTVPPFYFRTANRNRIASIVTAARAPRPAAPTPSEGSTTPGGPQPDSLATPGPAQPVASPGTSPMTTTDTGTD